MYVVHVLRLMGDCLWGERLYVYLVDGLDPLCRVFARGFNATPRFGSIDSSASFLGAHGARFNDNEGGESGTRDISLAPS